MRYLILSDIHANITALDAALAAVKGRWEKCVCLGDVVGYGPDPNEVVDRIREIAARTIRGNHDKAGSGVANADDFNPVARNVALWTREQLRPENREWLEKLPLGPVSENGFSMVHGAYRDEDEYVFAPAQALDGLLDAQSPVTFFGHTHLQGGFLMRDNKVGVLHFKPAADSHFDALSIEPGTIYQHAIAMNRKYKQEREFVSWHELFVNQAATFEYVNCHPRAGLLPYFEPMAISR